jgi:single-stranded DNA-binding protein
MNEVIISGIIKGEFENASRDGVKFSILNRGRNNEPSEFIALAYGNSGMFLKQHAKSGQRVVIQGRLSSEKLDTQKYHTAVTVSRVLSLGDSSQGLDFTQAFISGLASSTGLTNLANANSTPVINLNIANLREYTNQEGDKQQYTTYLGATIWNQQAQAVAEAFSFPFENVPVVIEGILRPRSYPDKEDGETINKIDIWVNSMSVSVASPVASQPPARKNQEPKGTSATRRTKPLESDPF